MKLQSTLLFRLLEVIESSAIRRQFTARIAFLHASYICERTGGELHYALSATL